MPYCVKQVVTKLWVECYVFMIIKAACKLKQTTDIIRIANSGNIDTFVSKVLKPMSFQ